MSRYGEAAILAIKYYKDKIVDSPEKGWEKACQEIFPDSTSSQKKGCPKNTFLSLCEEGYCLGIPKGHYLHKQNNVEKEYAIKAPGILHTNPTQIFSPSNLWDRVMEGTVKVHNSQMDVVLALRSKNLLKI